MKRYYINDTVEFRVGEKHMYGVIVKEYVGEDEKTFDILAAELLYRGISEADILKDFGSEE